MNIALIGVFWLALGVVVSLVFCASVRFTNNDAQDEGDGDAGTGREATDPWTADSAERRDW